MINASPMFRRLRSMLVPLAALVLAGCIYDVPITASATRSIDARLVGDTIPRTVRTSGEIRRLLRQNLANPRLYADEPLEMVRRK